ncbi:MAG: hypothetical protein KF887_17365 [Paracoccaceae bacterium]|nr:MAG: hypothetical protein KF887_17365 [Paracoccaceae bacterium]
MGTYDVAGAELKKMIKVAKKGPISFGFNPAKDDEASYCGMHRTKPPATIGKEAKEEGEGPKFTFGTAEVSGKLITLTVLREMPGLAKKFKRFLKSHKVMLNVQILDEDGNVIESDIEEDLPEDPELDGETAEDEGEQADGEPEADAAIDTTALLKRLAEIRGRIGALPPEAAARLAGPFREVVELAKAGEVARAAAGADRIEAAIAMLGRQATADATAPDPEMQKLRQLVQAMRDKSGSVADDATRAAILEALSRADGLIAQREAEQAVTILKKVQQLFARLAGDTVAAGPADSAAAAWEKRFRELEPRVNAALSQGLVADVDGLRRQWNWATGNAAEGAFDKAIAALPAIEALLAAVPQGGQTAFETGIAPDAQPFAKARVLWSGARARMLSEVKRLEAAILAACADDELMTEVSQSVSILTQHVLQLDARLEDKMDEIVNAPAGPARDQLKQQASSLIAEYRKTLEAEFFQDVDQASGFGSFAVTATATAALAEISSVLA